MWVEWASFNQSKACIEHRAAPFPFPSAPHSSQSYAYFLPVDLIETLAFLGPLACGLVLWVSGFTNLHNCIGQFLIINLFIPTNLNFLGSISAENPESCHSIRFRVYDIPKQQNHKDREKDERLWGAERERMINREQSTFRAVKLLCLIF